METKETKETNGSKIAEDKKARHIQEGDQADDVVLVPLSKIKVNWKDNVRSTYDAIEELAAQIKAEGLLTPLTVDQNFKLIAGFRRYKALSEHLYKEKPETLVKVTTKQLERPEHAALINIGENTGRKDVSDYDLAKRLIELEDENKFGLKRSFIARWTGLAQSEISKLITTYTNLSPKLQKAWAASAAGELKDKDGKAVKLPTVRLRDWSRQQKDEAPDAKMQEMLLEAFLDGDRPLTRGEEDKGDGKGEKGEVGGKGGKKEEIATRAPKTKEIKEYVLRLEERKKKEGLDETDAGRYSALRWVLGPAACEAIGVNATSRP